MESLKKLNLTSVNAIGMPYLGFGTFQSSPQEVKESCLVALKAGYRHIDTAEFYQNEEGVGDAIQESKIPRDQIFVTTKLWPGYANWAQIEKDYNQTIETCKESLKKLKLDYVDLYLIHAPAAKSTRLEQWKALVELKKQGLAKNIGVSNYGEKHLQEIEDAGLPTPAVNQIEIHPLCCQKKILKIMEGKGILPIAYSSLTPLSTWRVEEGQGGDITKDERKVSESNLKNLSEKYGVSQAQLLLRWALQHKFCILPKSNKAERIKNNCCLYEFNISPEDMAELDALDMDKPLTWAKVAPGFNPLDFD